MKNYLKALNDIMTYGDLKGSARPGMPHTKELFCINLSFDLQKGFPIVTTKKLFLKGALAELLWLMSGNTNIKPLVDQNVKNWNDDAYKYYVRNLKEVDLFNMALTKEEWLEKVKKYGANSPTAVWGATGNTYGQQWRKWGGSFDQLQHVLDNLKNNPNSRYHIVSAWNPTDYLEHPENAALPACHVFFQFSVRAGKYLDLMMMQRSCDMFLGVPFDFVMYAALCHIYANILGLEVGVFNWVGNSCHIYANHFDAVEEQLLRAEYLLPTFKIKRQLSSLDDITLDDFVLENYNCHPAISAPLSVGI